MFALTLATSCSEKDFIIKEDTPLAEGQVIVPITFSVGDFMVGTPDSRGLTPSDVQEEATEDERRISNVWLFQYGTDGNALIEPRYYTISPGRPAASIDAALMQGATSTIYAVANINDANWAGAANRSKFDTLEKLKAMSLPNTMATVDNQKDAISIPMSGCAENVSVSGLSIVIPVERMFAKLKIKVNIGKANWDYKNINVRNIPNTCPVHTAMTDGSAATYDDASDNWFTRYKANVNDGGEYDYIIYVPENIQGIGVASDHLEKTEYAPEKALNVYVEIKYTAGTQDNEFTVYPGGNNYNDYNIQRNYVYDIHLDIKHPERGAVNVPSANCIVVPTASEKLFEPYYRPETGGGFSITDYLDEDDTSENKDKVIDHVGIIWQTLNVIGDNTTGDKVMLVKESYYDDGTMSKQEMRYNSSNKSTTTYTYNAPAEGNAPTLTKTITKIQVKTNKEGNALIGAYNKKGDIIWSWHIWCTDMEPDNVGKALVYTTYPWDENGIDSSRRIPGYPIMPCNLGAMSADVDATRNASYPYDSTRGLVFQWGRKDPFPLSKYTYYSGRTIDYSYSNIVNLYDNANKQITKMTNTDQGVDNPNNYVFYSLTAKTTYTKLGGENQAVNYTVSHPTAYMCGSTYAGTTYSGMDLSERGDIFYGENGDWDPSHNTTLWGGLPPDDNLKHLVITASTYNILYDNYGTEKSIFDPCPKGWRVSPPDLWLEFTETGYNAPNSTQLNYRNYIAGGLYMYLQAFHSGPVSFFPVPGFRRADGMISHTGQCGNYHNATCSTHNVVNCMHVHKNAEIFNKVFENEYILYRVKSIAGPIRCVRATR